MVLAGLSGHAAPGQLVALMGASGAGKSSLIDILSGTRKAGAVSGSVSLVCAPGMDVDASCIGYVEQDMIFVPTQTVREAVLFAAFVRLAHGASGLSDAVIRARVESVLEELQLLGCADTRIGAGAGDTGGSHSGGISGGECRRLAIALELVARPPVLLLDEPTSGLDAPAAVAVLTVLRDVARQHACTVICAIHQPPSAVYPLLDALLLVAPSHRVAFFGPPAAALTDLVALHSVDVPPHCNPLELVVTPALLALLADTYARSATARAAAADRVALRSRPGWTTRAVTASGMNGDVTKQRVGGD